MASEATKNDKAWADLFTKYQILETVQCQGYIEITASAINEFREARLMTKFDHRANLPELFAKNKLAILPITRGSYIISNFEAYKDFEQIETEITSAIFPVHIESIDYENITSEATAINCAYVSGILADFINDEELLPTVSGRMSSNKFSFDIRNIKTRSNVAINVVNSQVEIDGGYEGVSKLSLIEAKNFLSGDFLIRQLYYPYRLWLNNVTKKVVPIFLVYSNSIFTLYEYEFQDINNYNSLVLVKQKNYSLDSVEIVLDDIITVLDKVKIKSEPEISFPQADSFKRVINLCELLFDGSKTKDEITMNYAFDERQTNYYTDAGRYLGLINKSKEDGKITFNLSDEGRKVIRLKYKPKQLRFVELILSHRVFNVILRQYLQNGEVPKKQEIVSVMKQSNLFRIGKEDTYQRRASTISGWINWILDLQR